MNVYFCVGNATRLCDQNGKWEEPNFNNCRTFTGQQLNTIVSYSKSISNRLLVTVSYAQKQCTNMRLIITR